MKKTSLSVLLLFTGLSMAGLSSGRMSLQFADKATGNIQD